MTDKLNQIETRYGDYKRIHTRKIQERKKLKSMIEEKNSLSPIHVFQRKDIDRKINGQEAVVRDLIEQEKVIMSWFGKTDTASMKEINAEITRLQERITDADQVIEDSESRIEEEKQEYVEANNEGLRSKDRKAIATLPSGGRFFHCELLTNPAGVYYGS